MKRTLEGLEVASVDLKKYADALDDGTREIIDMSGFTPVEITDEITVILTHAADERDVEAT